MVFRHIKMEAKGACSSAPSVPLTYGQRPLVPRHSPRLVTPCPHAASNDLPVHGAARNRLVTESTSTLMSIECINALFSMAGPVDCLIQVPNVDWGAEQIRAGLILQ